MRRLVGLAVITLAACGRGEDTGEMVARDPVIPRGSREWKLRSARSAAPVVISDQAELRDWADSGAGPMLLIGSNGWTCYPDNPATPDDDPFCGDEEFLRWRAGSRPRGMGIAYMLRGGDPRIEIVMPNPRRSFAGIPASPRPDGPWVRDQVLIVPMAAR